MRTLSLFSFHFEGQGWMSQGMRLTCGKLGGEAIADAAQNRITAQICFQWSSLNMGNSFLYVRVRDGRRVQGEGRSAYESSRIILCGEGAVKALYSSVLNGDTAGPQRLKPPISRMLGRHEWTRALPGLWWWWVKSTYQRQRAWAPAPHKPCGPTSLGCRTAGPLSLSGLRAMPGEIEIPSRFRSGQALHFAWKTAPLRMTTVFSSFKMIAQRTRERWGTGPSGSIFQEPK